MSDKTIGLYEKFKVERTDGSSVEGGKHAGCEYFVLDLTHDPLAIPALETYAYHAEKAGYALLAADLRAKVVLCSGAAPATGEPTTLSGRWSDDRLHNASADEVLELCEQLQVRAFRYRRKAQHDEWRRVRDEVLRRMVASAPAGASGTEEENDLTAESLSVQLDDMASECESSAAQSRGLRESESQINAYLDDALRFRKTAMYLRSYVSLLAAASAPSRA